MAKYILSTWGYNSYNQNDRDSSIICCPLILSQLNFRLKSVRFNILGLGIQTENNAWFFYGQWDKIWNLKHIDILDVDASDKRILVHTTTGELLVKNCCNFEWHKLCLQLLHKEDNDGSRDDSETKIKSFSIEDNSLILLSEDGKLFSSGIEIFLPCIKFKEVDVGKEHCLALTEEGHVYSWGSGMRGQLGNDNLQQVDAPILVEELQGIQFTAISCGGWHSIALSESGDVYVWGWNDVGQLGFPSKALKSGGVKLDLNLFEHSCQCSSFRNEETNKCSLKYMNEEEIKTKENEFINEDRSKCLVNVQSTPKLLDFWNTEVVIRKVACGDRHTAFLLDDNSLWTSGWNRYGQLGIGSMLPQDEPKLVSLFPVTDVFAGAWTTVAIQGYE